MIQILVLFFEQNHSIAQQKFFLHSRPAAVYFTKLPTSSNSRQQKLKRENDGTTKHCVQTNNVNTAMILNFQTDMFRQSRQLQIRLRLEEAV